MHLSCEVTSLFTLWWNSFNVSYNFNIVAKTVRKNILLFAQAISEKGWKLVIYQSTQRGQKQTRK